MHFRGRAVLSLLVLVGFGSIPLAHHSVSGQFDLSKTTTLKGIISRLDWINPHIYVYLDVPEANGAKNTWTLETFPPSQMKRVGLTKELIMGQSGEVVSKARESLVSLGRLLVFVQQSANGQITRYPLVGLLSAFLTLTCIYLGRFLRPQEAVAADAEPLVIECPEA